MERLPIIRGVPTFGHPGRLAELHKVRRTLPPNPKDTTAQCFLQDETSALVRDEVSQSPIFDDYQLGCGTAPSTESREPDLRDPFPVPSRTPGAHRRGQREFFNPGPFPTTFQDCDEIIHEIIPPPPPPPPPPAPEGTLSINECQSQLTFGYNNIDDFIGLRFEIGPTESGPWTTYLTRESIPDEVVLSNYFDGVQWVRLSAKAVGNIYVPFMVVKPPAAIVAPPSLEFMSNVSDIGSTLPRLSTSPLDGTQVMVTSFEETPLVIEADKGYVEIRRRLQYLFDQYVGVPPTPTKFTHPDSGVTIRYTTDGSEPSLFNGFSGTTDTGAGGYEFGHLIRAVAIKDGCTSPECIIAVDKRTQLLPQIGHFLNFNGGVSGSCDLPRDDGSGQESTASCNVNYGGTAQFKVAFIASYVCAFNSQGTAGHVIWFQTTGESTGAPVNGYAPFTVSVSSARFDHSTWTRPFQWDFAPSGLHATAVMDADKEYAGTQVTGPGGSDSQFVSAYNAMAMERNAGCPADMDGSDAVLTAFMETSRIPPVLPVI